MEPLKVTLLGYGTYSFKDDNGKQVQGTTVHFLEQTPQNDEYGFGFIPRKVTMPYEFQNNLKGIAFPYSAEPVMVTRFTSKGAKAVIEDFVLDSPVKIVSDKIKIS